jgi:hypothetical protein
MRIVILFILSLMVAGCASQNIPAVTPIVNKYHVILPPEGLYQCPTVSQLPKIKTLTDIQVGQTLVRYAQNNKICAASLASIKRYLNNAKKKFEQGPS